MSLNNIIYSQSVGNNNTISQALSQEIPIQINSLQTDIMLFLVPTYNIQGATYEFYNQDVNGISTNLNNQKTFNIIFTSNTQSLSGNLQVYHEIYRLPIEDWSDFLKNPSDISKKSAVSDRISNPFYTYKIVAQNIFNILNAQNSYSVQLPQKVKKTGSYIEDLLIDKAQYFIDLLYEFEINNNLNWGDIQINDNNTIQTIIPYYTAQTSTLLTSGRLHLITGGTFSGNQINGAFFTYFVVPQKPNLYVSEGRSLPSVIGPLRTFTPIWNFNNVGDGDRYKLQVTYDVDNLDFDKLREFVEFDIAYQPGDTEFIRTFSVPLTPKKDFLYRIGNVKEIENIFGIRQYVENYCDYLTARTASDNTFILSGHTYKNYINNGVYDPISSGYTGYTYMSGVEISIYIQVNKSTIYLGADSKDNDLIFQNTTQPLGGSIGFLSTIESDANGYYNFGSLQAGIYTLRVVPPTYMLPGLYPTQSLTVNLTRDTNFDIILSILWGNQFYDFTLNETFL